MAFELSPQDAGTLIQGKENFINHVSCGYDDLEGWSSLL